METELHVEAILHLNAFALIVTIAYLGLDRVHLEQDAFLQALDKARNDARTFVRRCDVIPGQPTVPTSMFYSFPFWVKLKFYTLCQIAAVNGDVVMGFWWRAMHCCHRQRYVPMLGYFKNRRDRGWISICSATLLITFLYLTAAAVWHLKFFPAGQPWWLNWLSLSTVIAVTYGLCVAVLIWIFATVGVTYLLQCIVQISESLQGVIDKHLATITEDAVRYSEKKALDGTSVSVQ